MKTQKMKIKAVDAKVGDRIHENGTYVEVSKIDHDPARKPWPVILTLDGDVGGFRRGFLADRKFDVERVVDEETTGGVDEAQVG